MNTLKAQLLKGVMLGSLLWGMGAVAADPLTGYAEDLSSGVDAAAQRALTRALASRQLTIDGNPTLSQLEGVITRATLARGLNAEFHFDDSKLTQLVQNTGLSSWAGLETPVLAWIVEENGTEQTLVGSNAQSMFASALAQAAVECKYKFMFPVLDLDDVQIVKPDTVLNHRDGVLTKASGRYGNDYFISASVSAAAEDKLTLKWNLFAKDGRRLSGADVSGTSAEVARGTARGIARAIAELSSAQEVAAVDMEALGTGNGFVRVRFSGINNLGDFAAVRAKLLTFGYGQNSWMVAYAPEGMVVEIPTESQAALLEGSLQQTAGFTKEGDHSYHYDLGGMPGSIAPNLLGPRISGRVGSQMQPRKAAAAPAAAAPLTGPAALTVTGP